MPSTTPSRSPLAPTSMLPPPDTMPSTHSRLLCPRSVESLDLSPGLVDTATTPLHECKLWWL
ncbi:hypothetical protein HPB48_021432 [Haemaphysalis longicornis]|uniref:Uncharacterized protein n=1 Tax=Haemaphysalis longicornis TaxID=44386 RepID=A0A9J6G8V1_HAELO|nr:hypothetical protein HPB48_021432 [Haemaphysalis longicornis]